MRRALICGISGQDGAYLTRLLLEKGYHVTGTSRDVAGNPFANLCKLGLLERVELASMDLENLRSVQQVLDQAAPDEIYHLAGQSSVGLSFAQPVETFSSITIGTLNLLEAVRRAGRAARIFNAGSGECFGDTGDGIANEDTLLLGKSPYAVAKTVAYMSTMTYRETARLWVSTGILFNHESPLRSERFVTRKIVAAACRIAGGSDERLKLGTLSIVRDWGWAPEYVEAIWRMLQQDAPRDYVIATGDPHSLEDLVREVFAALELDWREHVDLDSTLARPREPSRLRGDPARILNELGWKAQCLLPELARRLVLAERGVA